MAAANTVSSEIPRSILWSEYYGVFCPADTKAGFNSDPRLGSGPGPITKAQLSVPPSPSTFQQHKRIRSLTRPRLLGAAAAAQPRPVRERRSRASRLITVAEQKAASDAPKIERFPREPCRGSTKTPASPSSRPCCPT